MLAALASPWTQAELKYEELINISEMHFCPKNDVLASQHNFLSTSDSG
jgi:hypothetical protein